MPVRDSIIICIFINLAVRDETKHIIHNNVEDEAQELSPVGLI